MRGAHENCDYHRTRFMNGILQMQRIAVLLAALMVASPSMAQTILPRPDPATSDREGVTKGDSARRTMDQYAKCVLGRKRGDVLAALAQPSGSLEQGQALSKLLNSDCIDYTAELQFNAPIFLGSLYTALVRAKFARKEVSFGPEPVDYSKQPLPEGSSPPVAPVAQLLNFASCVIHKDAKNSRDAIVAAAGSPKENAAMAELSKVYGLCLYSDQTLRFSKANLKGVIAEAYYREADAPAQQSPAP
jgi:hypothetical protein